MSDDIFDFSGLDTSSVKKNSQEEIEIFVKDLFDEMENMSNDQIIKNKDYSLLFEDYLSMFHRTVDDDYTDIVPINFTISDDIDRKIDILKDCLNQAILIKDSSLYMEMMSGFVVRK